MILEATQLKVTLGGRRILDGVDLSLAEGEIYGLLGPNGAGKTTTISAILGLVPLEAGTVRIGGEDPSRDRRVLQRVGVLPEQNGFYDWMTAVDYLRFFAMLYDRPSDSNALQSLLERVGLETNATQVIGTFSRGMRQRLGIARALIPDPRLLILDEPTIGLDPRGRREIHDLLLDLSGQHGVGVLLCTHLLDDVDRLCRRIGIIVGGRTLVQGELAELLRHGERLDRYRLRLDGPAPVREPWPQGLRVITREAERLIVAPDPSVAPPEAWRELLFLGWPVVEIQREGSGLEDLYLALTEPRP
jgi:ABC-2 type transport system ATP-binding protein